MHLTLLTHQWKREYADITMDIRTIIYLVLHGPFLLDDLVLLQIKFTLLIPPHWTFRIARWSHDRYGGAEELGSIVQN